VSAARGADKWSGADISLNRKALHEYHILDRIEAGIELKGTEVKSIRAGLANVGNAYARVEDGQVWLYDLDIQAYEKASFEQHVPKRRRRLLLHRREIDKLFGKVQIEGHALVALRLYWKDARVKVELGVGKGKLAHDKRDVLKAKVEKREADRAMSDFNKRRR
jgi:SsrA-binding protein